MFLIFTSQICSELCFQSFYFFHLFYSTFWKISLQHQPISFLELFSVHNDPCSNFLFLFCTNLRCIFCEILVIPWFFSDFSELDKSIIKNKVLERSLDEVSFFSFLFQFFHYLLEYQQSFGGTSKYFFWIDRLIISLRFLFPRWSSSWPFPKAFQPHSFAFLHVCKFLFCSLLLIVFFR